MKQCDVMYFVPSDLYCVMIQLLLSHTYKCSPCLQPTTVNNMEISDTSMIQSASTILSSYIETVVLCLTCNTGLVVIGNISYVSYLILPKTIFFRLLSLSVANLT